MKNILCYGDSNTFGLDGKTGNRFTYNKRWTGILQNLLGDDYYIIEEGLGGRTTVWDDPIELYKNGRTYLIPCLNSHMPLDLVIIMLGTNDLKKRFDVPASDIVQAMEVLIKDIELSECGVDEKSPEILLIAPIIIEGLTKLSDMLEGGVEKSKKLPKLYENLAKKHGIGYLDCNTVVKVCMEDGVHFDNLSHRAFAKELAKKIINE